MTVPVNPRVVAVRVAFCLLCFPENVVIARTGMSNCTRAFVPTCASVQCAYVRVGQRVRVDVESCGCPERVG